MTITKVAKVFDRYKVGVETAQWQSGGWMVDYGHDGMSDNLQMFLPFARVCDYLQADDNAQMTYYGGNKVDVQDHLENLETDDLFDMLADIINIDQQRTDYFPAKHLDHQLSDTFGQLATFLQSTLPKRHQPNHNHGKIF